jgi:putative tricarboxylic transport membrane protein
MNYLHSLGGGLAYLGNPLNDIILVVGTVLGVFVGAIPGLGGIVLMVVLLPFLYNKDPALALALLLGSHSAIYYAGSTTAILINTPGAPESAATCIDGYAMTRRGEAPRALGISAASTAFGGLFGAAVILAAVPVMLSLVNVFHPPEYFLLAILAIVVIGQLQAGSVTKGLLSGLFGFMLSFVGAAASTGTLRFTLGNLQMYNGINTATAAIGLFAISQMFILYGTNRRAAGAASFMLSRDVWAEVRAGIREVAQYPWLTLRSAVLGVLCGVIPGIGATAANFLSYGQAMRTSRNPERFGTGTPEGIIAPEASSISKEAGALIPTVALGVPNGPAMAVILAAFSILGLAPGPSMLTTHLSLVFWMVVVLAVSSLLASAIGLGLAPVLAKVTTLPSRLLVPFVLTLATVGAFASTGLMLQVALMMAFGVVGLSMRRYNYSLPAVIVGLVLGLTAENNLDLTVQLFSWRFVERPLSDVLLAVILAVIALGYRNRSGRRASRVAAARQTGEGAAGRERGESAPGERPRRPVVRSPGELVVDIVWVVGAALYVNAARHYPSPANIGPTYLGLAALIVGAVQLVGGFFPGFRRITIGGRDALAVTGTASAVPAGAAAGTSGDPLPPAAVGVPQAAGTVQVAVADGPDHLITGDRADFPVPHPGGPAADADDEPGEAAAPGPRAHPDSRGGRTRILGEAGNQALCVAMGAVLIAGIYLLGFVITVPAFVFLYLAFVYRWTWWKTILATVIMAAALLFVPHSLGIVLPSGVL